MASKDIPSATPAPRRCLGTTVQGRPCRAWAAKGHDRCSAHRRQANHPNLPPPPRLSTIDDLIQALLAAMNRLGAMVDEAYDEGDTQQYFKSLAVYSRCIPHLSGLLRIKRHFPAQSADDVWNHIDRALDEIGEEYGIQL